MTDVDSQQLDLFGSPGPAPRAAPAGSRSRQTNGAVPTDCRRAAREAILPHLGPLQAFAAVGPKGLTDEELAYRLGLRQNSVRPRRIELQKLGLLADTGRDRETESGRDAAVRILAAGLVTAAAGIDGGGGEVRKGRIGLGLPGLMLKREREGRCVWCGRREFWISVAGVRTCRACHPPPAEELVASRVESGE